jgi:hypothetical protein
MDARRRIVKFAISDIAGAHLLTDDGRWLSLSTVKAPIANPEGLGLVACFTLEEAQAFCRWASLAGTHCRPFALEDWS